MNRFILQIDFIWELNNVSQVMYIALNEGSSKKIDSIRFE